MRYRNRYRYLNGRTLVQIVAPPFSMSRLWHHVNIPTEVDGFVIPSPTWLPRFCPRPSSFSLSSSHTVLVPLSSFSLSLSLSLSLFSSFSPPISTVSLTTSPLPLALRHAHVRNRRRGRFFFPLLSSCALLLLSPSFFSSLHREREKSLLPLSLSPFLPRPCVSLSLSRRKFPSRGEISFSLFFSSFSHSLILFLTFFLACASLSLSLSLAKEISIARRDFFFSHLSLFRKLFPSFS